MNEQQLIVMFLAKSGFRPSGENQFYNEKIGRIFIRTWDAQKVFSQIMELGEKHYAKKMRDFLMVESEATFKPTV